MSTPAMKYVLVTGTNGGLGFGICRRLIDDFLHTEASPSSSQLTLIFTTRDTRKGTATLKLLDEHLKTHHLSTTARDRIHFQPEIVELSNLLSIRKLARKLLESSVPRIDVIICNAGVAGWSGLDWPTAIASVILDLRTNTTWPSYKLGIAGLTTPEQLPPPTSDAETRGGQAVQKSTEPILGQIFCANVFGHYMLAHWLVPLLQACEARQPGRIIWVSSVEPCKRHFNEADFQGVRSKAAYEHSKRMTDLIALNYDREYNTASRWEFCIPTMQVESQTRREARSLPTMYVAHPGVCTTSIMSLYWIMQKLFVCALHLARLVGSPWATCSTYTAALTMTWLTLASPDEILEKEFGVGGGRGGRVKWGTGVSRLGMPTVRPTEVEGWGLNGSGDRYMKTWWAGRLGRAPGASEATREDVEQFQELGKRVWTKMEDLRREWEERIEEYENSTINGHS